MTKYPRTNIVVVTWTNGILQMATNVLGPYIDDEQILEVMNDCLTHFGHRVRVASGGKRGIELFCTAILKSEPYDVVITDLSMTDMDGDQVARTIKDESPQTPIIMMTAWGANVKNDAAITSTVDAVVSKPPRMQELNDLLLRRAG